MNKITAGWIVFLVMAAGLGAQQYTRIGVVDLARIYTVYFRQSQAVRELEETRADLQRQIDRQNQEITNLSAQRLEAQGAGDNIRALRLEGEIEQKQNYLREFVRIRQAQLNNRRDALTRDNSFLNQVMGEIRFVAESKGFAMILRMDDPNLLHYTPDSDITEDVIRRLGGN